MDQNKNDLNQISLNTSSIVPILGTVAFLLIVASVVGQVITYHFGFHYVYNLHYLNAVIKLFYVDLEQNFPAYFSSFLLLFSAMLLLVITLLERKRKASHVSKWALLSICFLALALDEALCFHERLIYPMRSFLNSDNLGIFYYAWVIPGITFVIIFALFFLRFFLQLNTKTKLTFFIGAALYIAGAIGVEFINGYYAELHGEENLIYSMLSNIEECFEMAGSIVFIWGLLWYISDNFKAVHIQFASIGEHTKSNKRS